MKKALILVQGLLDPVKWGWTRIDNGWELLWATLPEASQIRINILQI